MYPLTTLIPVPRLPPSNLTSTPPIVPPAAGRTSLPKSRASVSLEYFYSPTPLAFPPNVRVHYFFSTLQEKHVGSEISTKQWKS